MKHESTIHKRSSERQSAWDILRNSPTVRMLAALAGPYWPQPTGRDLALAAPAANAELAERHVQFAEATRYRAPRRQSSSIDRREALLDDALDDSFPASDPPAIVAPVYGGWR